MRYVFLLLILMLTQVISCGIRKGNTLTTLNDKIEDNKSVRLDFNILSKEVSFREMKVMEYIKSELLAIIKHSNVSNEPKELYYRNFIIFENYEIKNINGESKDSLLQHYDYSIALDPDNYDYHSIIIEPKQFIIDTLNIIGEFRFDLAESDTFLIRVKKHYNEGYIYSNWDTLIIQ